MSGQSSFFSLAGGTEGLYGNIDEIRDDALAAQAAAEVAQAAAEAAQVASEAAQTASETAQTAAEAAQTAAAASATAAATSETNAAASAAAASTSETNAGTSETNAAASAAAALASETAAQAAQTAAELAETNAGVSETNAGASETNAGNSATAAAASAAAASTSEGNAATSETNAGTSETNAANSASAAAISETNAGTSETNAAASAAAAATSASNAATSETNADTAKTAAEAAQSAAETAYDNFDDRYLGAKASAPTLDNDGAALLTGALYWNSTTDDLWVYDGAAWASIGAPPVDSVNTQTGAVVLDADDIDDTSTTNKFTTAGDISKLAGIEANATADQTGAQIKAAYESEANAYTDTKDTKLSGIATGAEVNPTSNKGAIGVRCLDKDTDWAVATDIAGDIIVPYAGTITDIIALVDTAGVTGVSTIDVNKNGSTILSTKLTVDAGETSSGTAATAHVRSNSSLAAGDILNIDIDGIAGTAAKGCLVLIKYDVTV